MFFIFGWGHTTRKVVDSISHPCPKCTRGQVFSLEEVRTWFTLFFIPIIPYDTDYWLLCSDCECGFKLSLSEYEQLRLDIERARSLGARDRLAEPATASQLGTRDMQHGNATSSPAGPQAGFVRCANCGKLLDPNEPWCRDCDPETSEVADG